MSDKTYNIVIAVSITLVYILGALAVIFLTPGCGFNPTKVSDLSPDDPSFLTKSEQRVEKLAGSAGWLATLSILGIAISAMALINGSKSAIGFLAGSGIALVMSITVVKYAGLLAIIGLVGGLVLLGLAIWTKRKALIEIVKSVQDAKKSVGRIENTAMIDAGIKAALNNQSKPTQKIVKKIKEKLNASDTAGSNETK